MNEANTFFKINEMAESKVNKRVLKWHSVENSIFYTPRSLKHYEIKVFLLATRRTYFQPVSKINWLKKRTNNANLIDIFPLSEYIRCS